MIKAVAIALIGHGRIGETVAQHPGAARQRRPDGLDQMVAPGGAVQQRLGAAVPAVDGAVDQQGADGLGAAGTAGFACRHHLAAPGRQHRGQQTDLGRFAGALAAPKVMKRPATISARPHRMWRRASEMRPAKPSLATSAPAIRGNSMSAWLGAETTSLPTVALPDRGGDGAVIDGGHYVAPGAAWSLPVSRRPPTARWPPRPTTPRRR